MTKVNKSRGLKQFLQGMYNGNSPAQIEARINRELFKIKKAFMGPRLKPYDRWKYMVKLCFIFMWGYPVDFGFTQIMDMIQSKIMTQKRGGWMAAGLFLSNDPEQVMQLIPILKTQLSDVTNEWVAIIALNAVSALCGASLADAVGPMVAEIVVHPSAHKHLRQRAIMTLAGLYQASQQLPSVDKVAPKLATYLTDETGDWGMRLAVANLILAIIVQQPALVCDLFPVVLQQLHSILVLPQVTHVWPLLVCKMIQILGFKADWKEEEVQMIEEICESVLRRCASKMDTDETISFCVMFAEVAALVDVVSLSEEVVQGILNVFLSLVESSTPYVVVYSLDTIANMVRSIPHCSKYVKPMTEKLLEMMKSGDRMTDEAAMQLLYVITGVEDGLQILSEFSCFLADAPLHMRESLAKKCLVLTQSYAIDQKWGIDKILAILRGYELYDENIWQVLVQYVTYDLGLQNYLLEKLLKLLTEHVTLTKPVLQLSAYAFGAFIENCPSIDVRVVFDLFCNLFDEFPENAQPMIVSSLAKFAVKFPEIKPDVLIFLEQKLNSLVVEVSQRSREYFKLLSWSDSSAIGCLNRSHSDTFRPPVPLAETGSDAGHQQELMDLVGDDEVTTYDSSELLLSQSLDLHVNVQITQPVAVVVLEMKSIAMKSVITQFEVRAPPELKYEVMDPIPESVLEEESVSISIRFIALDIFEQSPKIHIVIDNRNDVDMVIPISMRNWTQHFPLDKDHFSRYLAEVTDPACCKTINLLIPDGDVIQAVCDITLATFGLKPVDLELPDHVVVMAGVFKCLSMTIMVRLEFIYHADDVDLILSIKATTPSAVKVITNLVREAFSM